MILPDLLLLFFPLMSEQHEQLEHSLATKVVAGPLSQLALLHVQSVVGQP